MDTDAEITMRKASVNIIAIELFLVLASVVLCLLFVEFGARGYVKMFMPPQTLYDYRLSSPLPYRGASYYSKEFIEESFRQPDGWQFPDGTRLIIPNDFHGKYFNVVDGKRITVGQPDVSENTIYVFGGSTIYNSEVPDDLTIPSFLQRLFSSNYGDRFKVENLGTTTVTTAQQLERLKTINLKPNDIVVFYDGVNDVLQGVYQANPEETMVETNRRIISEMGAGQRLLFYVFNWLQRRSTFVKIFFDPYTHEGPEHLKDKELVNILLAGMGKRYQGNIMAAASYAAAHDVLFFHFLQPQLFSKNGHSKYEKELMNNKYIVHAGTEYSFRAGYKVLKDVQGKFVSLFPNFDVSNALDDQSQNDEYYLDFCHVEDKANEKIARVIFERIKIFLDSHGQDD